MQAQTVAQTELGKPHFIITKDGKEILGVIEKETNIDILVITKAKKEILIQKSNIKILEPVKADNFHRGKYVRPNPIPNLYYFTTSAIPLEKKTANLSASLGAFSFDYGLNNNISLGIRSTAIGLPVWVNGQANSKISDQFYIGISGNACWLSWAEPNFIFGWGGVKLTTGSSNNNSTLGAGFLKLSLDIPVRQLSRFSQSDFVYVNISSMKRVTKKIAFTGEFYSLKNLYFRQFFFMANLGVKTMKREKSSWSFFIANFLSFEFRSGEPIYYPFPAVAWTRKLGKNQ